MHYEHPHLQGFPRQNCLSLRSFFYDLYYHFVIAICAPDRAQIVSSSLSAHHRTRNDDRDDRNDHDDDDGRVADDGSY